VAAAQAQCYTLASGRKGSASAAFERKVFTRCAIATHDDPPAKRRPIMSLGMSLGAAIA
jgi:hypothetical protein